MGQNSSKFWEKNLNSATLNINGIESRAETDVHWKPPESIASLRDALLDFDGAMTPQGLRCADVPRERVPPKTILEVGNDHSDTTLKFYKDKGELARDVHQLAKKIRPGHELKWLDLLRRHLFSRWNDLYDGNQSGAIAMHSDILWTNGKEGTLYPDPKLFTIPKPDIYLAIRAEARELSQDTPTRQKRVRNFFLESLAECEGLIHSPSKQSDGQSGKLDHHHQVCFPFTIVEIKHQDVSLFEKRKCYAQAANACSVALSMLARLCSKRAGAQYWYEAEHDVLPVIAFTFIGHQTKLWLSYVSDYQNETMVHRYRIQCIWDGDIRDPWDSLQLCCILDNLQLWYDEVYKPWVSGCLDLWHAERAAEECKRRYEAHRKPRDSISPTSQKGKRHESKLAIDQKTLGKARNPKPVILSDQGRAGVHDDHDKPLPDTGATPSTEHGSLVPTLDFFQLNLNPGGSSKVSANHEARVEDDDRRSPMNAQLRQADLERPISKGVAPTDRSHADTQSRSRDEKRSVEDAADRGPYSISHTVIADGTLKPATLVFPEHVPTTGLFRSKSTIDVSDSGKQAIEAGSPISYPDLSILESGESFATPKSTTGYLTPSPSPPSKIRPSRSTTSLPTAPTPFVGIVNTLSSKDSSSGVSTDPNLASAARGPIATGNVAQDWSKAAVQRIHEANPTEPSFNPAVMGEEQEFANESDDTKIGSVGLGQLPEKSRARPDRTPVQNDPNFVLPGQGVDDALELRESLVVPAVATEPVISARKADINAQRSPSPQFGQPWGSELDLTSSGNTREVPDESNPHHPSVGTSRGVEGLTARPVDHTWRRGSAISIASQNEETLKRSDTAGTTTSKRERVKKFVWPEKYAQFTKEQDKVHRKILSGSYTIFSDLISKKK